MGDTGSGMQARGEDRRWGAPGLPALPCLPCLPLCRLAHSPAVVAVPTASMLSFTSSGTQKRDGRVAVPLARSAASSASSSAARCISASR